MSSSPKKRPALGKGLSALLESSRTDITSDDIEDKSVLGSVALLAIDGIEANPFNPRTHFEEEALQELSDSIATHGIIQPITVRKLGRNKYQLISGERRFKASQMAGLTEIPAYIRVAKGAMCNLVSSRRPISSINFCFSIEMDISWFLTKIRLVHNNAN